jgi:hypothetical protein
MSTSEAALWFSRAALHQLRKSRLAEEKGEKAKLFGAPAEAEWKKRNTVLSVHL